MPGRPPFKPGAKKVASDWLNQVEKARAKTVDKVGQLPPEFPDTSRIQVVITKKPASGDKKLTVRRVSYNTQVPNECDPTCHYQFISPEFTAYPDPPNKVSDFDSLAETNPTLNENASYIYARREHGTWRLEKPAAGGGSNVRFALVKGITASAASVQPVKLSGTSFVNDGNTIVVRPQPAVSPNAYSMNLSNSQLTTGIYVWMVEVEGEWYIMGQGFNFDTGAQSVSPLSACT